MSTPAKEDYSKYDIEWQECRKTTARFDQILLDLRRYGFTILTGLITAGSFLGFSEPTAVLQIGVIIVVMVLIVVLYWLDIYYQNILYGAVLRANYIEIFRLERGLGLSTFISLMYRNAKLGRVLHLLYIGFLTSVFLLGYFVNIVTNYGLEAENQNNSMSFQSESLLNMNFLNDWIIFILLITSYIISLIGMILILVIHDSKKRAIEVGMGDILIKRWKEFENIKKDVNRDESLKKLEKTRIADETEQELWALFKLDPTISEK